MEAALSQAMDLIDNLIGPIDRQTQEQRGGDLDLPDDAEFDVTITAGQERGLNKAWHLLSQQLAVIRAEPPK